MAIASRAERTEGSGLFIRTFTISESAETRHIQSVAISDADDGTPADVVGESTFQKGLPAYGFDGTDPRFIRTDASGHLQVDALTLPSVTIGTFPDNEPFDLNQLAGTTLAVPFDVDSGAGTQNVIGVSIRKAASGGSAEYGTSADPLRVDPTGTTTQPVDDAAGSLTVDNAALSVTGGGVEATALRVTVASDSTGVLSVDDNAASLTVDNAALSVTGGGAEATALRVTVASDSTGVLSVDDNAGSLTVDQGAAGTAWEVVGDVAHDAPAAGNPLLFGAEAIAHGTNPTAVAAADATKLYANRAGVLFTIGGHPNVVTRRDNYTGAQTDAAIVTVSAGTKIVVTRCSVTADNANSVDVAARVGFGATTTPTGAGVVLSHPGIAAGSGVVEGNGAGILGVGADGEDLRITSEVPTGGSIDVVTSYYTVES